MNIRNLASDLAHSLTFLFALALLATAAPAQGRRDLQASIDQVVKSFESANPGSKVAVSSLVFKTGKIAYSYRGTTPMIPASNLKLVTTAVALDQLGPDFRFETKLYAKAPAKDGTATGDIVLKGGGDPTFYPPYVASSVAPLEELARALKAFGVKKVEGNLLVDDSDFDRIFVSQTHLERYRLESYAAPVGGLSLNRNVVTLRVSSDGISTNPSVGSLQLVNKVSAGGYDQIWVERPKGTDRIIVHGVAQPGSVIETTLTINDPVRFTASAFYRILNKAGIALTGKWTLVQEGKPASLAGLSLIGRHRSPTLKELIRETNVESDNLLAEHIFRRLGASVVGYGSARNGEAVVRDFFARHSIDATGLKMFDGCGLSESDRISPFQLVRVLYSMWGARNGQLYIDSLPAPGEGTLEGRLGGALLRAKTGTLNNHTALTGYVVTAYGQTVGFSILCNNLNQVWPGSELQDRIVSILSGWSQQI